MSPGPGWSAAADEDAPPELRFRPARTPLRAVVLRALARHSRPFPFVRLEPTRSRR